MNETLEKKQIELLRTLKVRFKEEPRSWWQTQSKKYKTTWEVGNTYDNYPVPSDETIIRYNLKAAIFTIAALLLYMLFLIFYQWDEKEGSPHYFYLFFLIFIFLELRNALDRKPKVIITKNSIRLQKLSVEVKWDNLLASYIEEDSSGDSTETTLLLFHYDEINDTVIESAFKLECFDVKCEEFCYIIEYWKITTGNRTPVL